MNSSVDSSARGEAWKAGLSGEETPPSPRPPFAGDPGCVETAFGCPRDFLGNRFVYAVFSPRARGLSIGVNMNPDKQCNFDCIYCEVNREEPAREGNLDVAAMASELEQTLAWVYSGRIRERPRYRQLPGDLLQLRHVALSGDGEPTLCSNFIEAVQTVIHVRAVGRFPFFKLVLMTNATGLDLPPVQQGLAHLTPQDEVWAKLDAGTQAHMDCVNRPEVPLAKVMENIRQLAQRRPVIIQSLFAKIRGRAPGTEEIEQYAQRLQELRAQGAQISLVQVYSATRPTLNPACEHLPLKSLSQIAQVIRQRTGLKAEVY